MTQTSTTNPRWLDLKRASSYSSMCRRTVLKRIHAGEIYAKLVDGKWYVDRDSLDAFFESDKVLVARLAKTR